MIKLASIYVLFSPQATSPDFRSYQEQVLKNAKAMGKALMDRGYTLVSGLYTVSFCLKFRNEMELWNFAITDFYTIMAQNSWNNERKH